MAVHAINLTTWEVETGRSLFGAILDYKVRPFQKKRRELSFVVCVCETQMDFGRCCGWASNPSTQKAEAKGNLRLT